MPIKKKIDFYYVREFYLIISLLTFGKILNHDSAKIIRIMNERTVKYYNCKQIFNL